MSERTIQRSPSEDSLCALIEHTPRHRRQAAEILMAGQSSVKALKIVIKHVPQLREMAALRLLEDEMAGLDDYEPIFVFVSSSELQLRAAKKIMASESESRGWAYAYVIEYVESLREEAMRRLLVIGARNDRELNLVWRFASAEVRDDQWHRYLSRGRLDYQVQRLISGGEGDLPERAWDALAARDAVENDILSELLYVPAFRDRAWELMVRNGFKGFGLLVRMHEKHRWLQDRIWEQLLAKANGEEGLGIVLLLEMLMDKDWPAVIRQRAMDTALERYPYEKLLVFLTDRYPVN